MKPLPILACSIAALLPLSARADLITEQNAFDHLNIDIQRDGVTGDGTGGGGSATAGREEFIEFQNNGAGVLSLNNYIFKDTNRLSPTITNDTTVTTYDFAFGAATGISLAAGQAMIISSTGTAPGATFVPRNYGGSLQFTKAQSFVTGATTIPNGAGGTRSLTGQDTSQDIGIGTTDDGIAAYNGPTSGNTLSAAGASLAAAASPQASYIFNGVTPAAHSALSGTLGTKNASPGLKSDGSSFVTPLRSVTKVGGIGALSGSVNAWSVDFGTVGLGDTVTLTLAVGNAAGLGGILYAVTSGIVSGADRLSLTSGGSQTLKLLGGESTSNYGGLGTINGFNHSDGASASNLVFTVNTSTSGSIAGSYAITVGDGYNIFTGNSVSLGTMGITFTGTVVPEPGALTFLGLGLAGFAGFRRGRRAAP